MLGLNNLRVLKLEDHIDKNKPVEFHVMADWPDDPKIKRPFSLQKLGQFVLSTYDPKVAFKFVKDNSI